MMKARMFQARAQLEELLAQHCITSGMTLRVHGDHLILGRHEADPMQSKPHHDDRVRLTRFSSTTFGLSVKRHTGRWERTPFVGTLDEMVDTIANVLQHLVAPY
jgi:hypothetical protein